MLTARLAERIGLSSDQLADHVPANPVRQKTPPRRSRPARQRTPLVGQAITLLLHYPAIAEKAQMPQNLTQSAIPGAEVLTTLLEQLRETPHLKTAAVLERWREHRFFERLNDLASAEILINATQAVAELNGLLSKLSEHERDQRCEELLAKARDSGLDETEKAELAELLAARGRGGRADSA